MKKDCLKGNTNGFTLIEMLITVIIIGILASIALPLYQKSMEKARVAKILPVLKTLYNAEQDYYLQYRKYPKTFDDLGLKMHCEPNPILWTTQMPASSACTIGEWTYQVYHNPVDDTYGMYAGRIKGRYRGTGFISFYTNGMHIKQGKDIKPGQILCAERISMGTYVFKTPGLNKGGEYCKKIFNGKWVYQGTMNEFELPK